MVQTSSSIKASLDSLTKKGLLFKTLKGAYRFSDTFMPYWISDLKRTLYSSTSNAQGICSMIGFPVP